MAKFDRVPFFFLDSNVESKLEISILKSKIVSIVLSNDYTWPVLYLYMEKKKENMFACVKIWIRKDQASDRARYTQQKRRKESMRSKNYIYFA